MLHKYWTLFLLSPFNIFHIYIRIYIYIWPSPMRYQPCSHCLRWTEWTIMMVQSISCDKTTKNSLNYFEILLMTQSSSNNDDNNDGFRYTHNIQVHDSKDLCACDALWIESQVHKSITETAIVIVIFVEKVFFIFLYVFHSRCIAFLFPFLVTVELLLYLIYIRMVCSWRGFVLVSQTIPE